MSRQTKREVRFVDHLQYEVALQAYNESPKAENESKGGKVRSKGHVEELLSLCSCLHFVLFRLSERWRGLHCLILARLCKLSAR